MSNYSNSETVIQIATNEIAKRDVWDFCLYYDNVFFSKRPFLKLVAYCFQWVIQKEHTPEHIIDYVKKEIHANNYYYSEKTPHKIAITLPPRAGKSYVISVCIAWSIGNYPAESIMRNACTERLYQKFSYDIRAIIRSEKFKFIFDIRLSKDKQSLDGWNTTEAKQVTYFGAGVGGTIIGLGASLVAITDDLYKSMIDALSENTQNKVKLWKESAHDTRLESGCPEIDIGTRWTKKDIIGITEKENEYDIIIRIKALSNNVSFCDDVKTTDEYLKIKGKISNFMWLAMYQQEPIEIEGVLFQLEKLQRFNMSELNIDNVEARIGIIDTADEGTDLFSFPIIYKIAKKYYIVDVMHTDESFEITKPLSVAKGLKHKLDYVKVETNSQGKDYYRYLKAELTDTTIRGVWSVPNKETRILMQSEWIIQNFYFRTDYEPNSQYALFIEHLTTYLKLVKNQKDDSADVMAAASQFIKKLFGLR